MTTTEAGIARELAAIVGGEHVLVDPIDRLAYTVDYYWVPRMLIDRGTHPRLPDAVVLPGSVDEVAAVVKFANRAKVPVIPWGGGSGSQGGILAPTGGIIVDLKRLDRILDIDLDAMTVRAEAGINGFELESALHDCGASLPHYPASVHSATLGGYLAPRGSGVLSTKYGKAEDLVLSIEVVLPTGEVINTLPFSHHASGPGLLPLFVGSEGTLGIITKATMRLVAPPAVRRFRALIFPSVDAGLEFGRRVMTARLEPLVLRLYDERSTIKVAARTLGLSIDHGAYMVMGFDGWPEIVDAQERRTLEFAREGGAEDLGEEPGERWWRHRYDFYFPPHVFELPALFGTTDTLATFADMRRLWRTRKQRLEQEFAAWGLEYIAHFSHWFPWGVMVYDRFMVPNPPADPVAATALHDEIWRVSVETALECGGTLNEHHGVGLKLARFMPQAYGAAFPTLERIKAALDPAMVLNPGKLGLG